MTSNQSKQVFSFMTFKNLGLNYNVILHSNMKNSEGVRQLHQKGHAKGWE